MSELPTGLLERPEAPTRRWRGPRRTPAGIWVPGLGVAVAALVPLLYLLVRAGQGGWAAWSIAWEPATWRLIVRTLTLATAVTGTAIAIAVPVGWLTVRSDVPLRRGFAVLTALPLVIPTYVGAFALIGGLAPGGLIEAGLQAAGWQVRLPRPEGFVGAYLSLTLFTYPYVLLTVQAALRGMDPGLEEASRTLGKGSWATFRSVTVPQLRPAVGAGSLLVLLYVLSDFGAVSLMRYSTFTRAIYLQYQAAFDRTPAAVLGLVLVLLTAAVVVTEARLVRDRGGQFRVRGAPRAATTVPLGRWRWPAAAGLGLLVTTALLLPVAVIVWWLARGMVHGEDVAFVWSAARHSLQVSGLGSVATVLAAVPVALWSARYPTRLGRVAERVAFVGYALPGIVVALSLVFLGTRVTPALYQTHVMLVAAYVVLFLPQAVGAIRASLLQVGPQVEEAARTLGSTELAALRRVVLPLARRGAMTGGALVFLTVMKELPATLLLAPIGFDTLATRVWSATDSAFFARAAAPALGLVVLGSIPLALLVIRERRIT